MDAPQTHWKQLLMPYKDPITVQAASLMALPIWFPLFARATYLQSGAIASELDAARVSKAYWRNPRNWYRGMSMQVVSQPVYIFMNYARYRARDIATGHGHRELPFKAMCAIDFALGASTGFVVAPSMVTLCRMQRLESGIIPAVRQVASHSILGAFWRGALPYGLGRGVFWTSLFSVSEKAHAVLLEKTQNRQIADFGAPAIAAPLACAVHQPLRLAAILRMSDPEMVRYRSAYQALKAVGWRRLYTGFTYRLGAIYVEFLLFRKLQDYLRKQLD